MAYSILAILVAMVSIQFGASWAKMLFPTLGVLSTTGLRLWFSTLMLWVIWKPWRHATAKKDRKYIALYGCSLGLMNLLFYQAIAHIPLGIGVALEFTGPLIVALVEAHKTSKTGSIKALDLLWIFLAAAGVFVLSPLFTSHTELSVSGVLFALGAGLCWACYIWFGQRAGKSLPGGVAVSYGMLVAALAATPFTLTRMDLHHFHGIQIWLSAVAVAFFSSTLPYSLEMIALKRLPPGTFGILMSLEPVIASVVGFIFLGERLNIKEGCAILLIVTAAFGVSLSPRNKQSEGLSEAENMTY